jgi:hypothetical protein
MDCRTSKSRQTFHFELFLLAQRPSVAVETARDDEVLITGSTLRLTAALDQVSTLEERSLLSFQRPVPVCSTA